MLIHKSTAENKTETEEDAFSPVTSTQAIPEIKFDSSGNESDDALISKFGGILRGSLSPEGGGVANMKSAKIDDSSLVDLKGRYYYDKFGFTPFDAEKHLALRKAYLEGLVWTLEYYYRGCPSWGKFLRRLCCLFCLQISHTFHINRIPLRMVLSLPLRPND